MMIKFCASVKGDVNQFSSSTTLHVHLQC